MKDAGTVIGSFESDGGGSSSSNGPNAWDSSAKISVWWLISKVGKLLVDVLQ